jgi:phosphate/sulfate permease
VSLTAAAQVLIAAIPLVAVVLLSVLSFFLALCDYRKQRLLIEKGLPVRPRNIDDKVLLVGIVSLFVGVGLLVFFAAKTGLSDSLLGGIIPTAAGLGIITHYLAMLGIRRNRERAKPQ